MTRIAYIVLTAALFVNFSTTAFAIEQTKGVVTAIDLHARTLTLQSGETFQFDSPGRLFGFVPGDRIGVAHTGSQGINTYNPHPATRDNIDIE